MTTKIVTTMGQTKAAIAIKSSGLQDDTLGKFVLSHNFVEPSLINTTPPKRPNRSQPISDSEIESKELCSDSNFMASFQKGAQELDEGKGVDWESAKKQLGL